MLEYEKTNLFNKVDEKVMKNKQKLEDEKSNIEEKKEILED